MEASIIISIFIIAMGITMNMAILLYREINSEHEQLKHKDLSCVDYFYTVWDIGEVINDK